MTVWLVFDASDQYPILEAVCATEEAAQRWIEAAAMPLRWAIEEREVLH